MARAIEFLQPGEAAIPYSGMKKVREFFDVCDHYPFSLEPGEINRPLDVFLDFDGVIAIPFTHGDQAKRLETVKHIAQRADSVTIWSGRFAPQTEHILWRRGVGRIFEDKSSDPTHLSEFPFLTTSSQDKLTQLMQTINPECEVKFILGREKLAKNTTFVQRTMDSLTDGHTVAVVGSSVFDIVGMKKVIKFMRETDQEYLFDQLYYFHTDYVLI